MKEREELLAWVDDAFGDFTAGKPHQVVEQIKEIFWQVDCRAKDAAEAKSATRIADLERQLAEAKAAVPVGKQIGWYTMGTKDGMNSFETPVLATNPYYISAHSEYEWLPVFSAPQVAEQTKEPE